MRFGIIGTGFISDWFTQVCGKVDGAEAAVIYSRNSDTGAEFAAKTGVPEVVTSLEELFSSDIDAVYVASPNGYHAEQSIAALGAGKHVLCEKPIATSLVELDAMIEASRASGKVLMEAIRPTHDATLASAREALPRLGRIWHAHFVKSQYSSRYDAFRAGTVLNAFDPSLGNSALGDIGVYALHPAIQFFGEPREVFSVTRRLSNGFEASGDVLLAYEDTSVTCRWSKVSAAVLPTLIEGEDASMLISDIAEPARIEIRYRDGRVEVLKDEPPQKPIDNMHYELADFLALCEAGEVEHEYLGLSRATTALMDTIRAQNSPRS